MGQNVVDSLQNPIILCIISLLLHVALVTIKYNINHLDNMVWKVINSTEMVLYYFFARFSMEERLYRVHDHDFQKMNFKDTKNQIDYKNGLGFTRQFPNGILNFESLG